MYSPYISEMMAIIRLVRGGQIKTRSDISEILSMRSTTVSQLVGYMVARNILHESIVKPSRRGRPAAKLSFNGRRFGAIFVSVIDRRLVAKSIDLDNQVLAEKSVQPPDDAGNDHISDALRKLVMAIAEEFPAGVEIGAVVLSLSGLLDVPRHLWCVSSRWPQLNNLKISEALADLPWPISIVRNLDAELAGIRMDENHQKAENTLLLHWGQGIGAAFSADGLIVNRNRGRFCEIGHWSLGNAKGRACTCGNKDCLETVAALWAVGPFLKASYPHLHLDEKGLAEDLRYLNIQDHPKMKEALTQMLRLTANLCQLLFPDRIILTGPFVQNPDIFRRFAETIAVAPLIKSLDKARVSVNEIGQNFEISGALHGPFNDRLQSCLSKIPADIA